MLIAVGSPNPYLSTFQTYGRSSNADFPLVTYQAPFVRLLQPSCNLKRRLVSYQAPCNVIVTVSPLSLLAFFTSYQLVLHRDCLISFEKKLTKTKKDNL